MTAAPPPLAADLEAGSQRLKLAAVRRVAPEVLQTATTQRWKPEELLRSLVATEIAARDEANRLRRHRAATFAVVKTFDGFDVTASPVPQATIDYLAGTRVGRAPGEPVPGRPAGTGKSHLLLAAGHAAVEAGHRVRYLSAAELVETLYRGLADNRVGRSIDTLLRKDVLLVDEVGFAPLDATGTQLLFRFVAAAYERPALGVASHWAFNDWGGPHHDITRPGGEFHLATDGEFQLAMDNRALTAIRGGRHAGPRGGQQRAEILWLHVVAANRPFRTGARRCRRAE